MGNERIDLVLYLMTVQPILSHSLRTVMLHIRQLEHGKVVNRYFVLGLSSLSLPS